MNTHCFLNKSCTVELDRDSNKPTLQWARDTLVHPLLVVRMTVRLVCKYLGPCVIVSISQPYNENVSTSSATMKTAVKLCDVKLPLAELRRLSDCING